MTAEEAYKNADWYLWQYEGRGLRDQEIADACGIDRRKAAWWRMKHGIAAHPFHPTKGRHLSEGHRAAISKANRGRSVSDVTRMKLVETGKKTARFDSDHPRWTGPDVTATCSLPSCDQQIIMRPRDYDRRIARGKGGVYCSPAHTRIALAASATACNDKRRIERVTVPCAYCGRHTKPMLPSYNEQYPRRFCKGRGCRAAFWAEHFTGENCPTWKGGLITLTCACGYEQKMARAEARRRHSDGYRCVKCSRKRGPENNQWRGGKSRWERDSAEYIAFKRTVRARTKHCELCGRDMRLWHSKANSYSGRYSVVAHVAPVSTVRRLMSDPGNGLLICADCHKGLDKGPAWYFALACEHIHWDEAENPRALLDALTDEAVERLAA